MKINTQVHLDKSDLIEAVKAHVASHLSTDDPMTVTINQGRGTNGTTADVIIGEAPKKSKAAKITEDVKKSSEGTLGAVLDTTPEVEDTETEATISEPEVADDEPTEEISDTSSLFAKKG